MNIREIIQKFPNPDDLIIPTGLAERLSGGPHPNIAWLKEYSEDLKELIDAEPTAIIDESVIKGVYMDWFNYNTPTPEEIKAIEEYCGKRFSQCAEWLNDIIGDMKTEKLLPIK